jgi:hypothetical protein
MVQKKMEIGWMYDLMEGLTEDELKNIVDFQKSNYYSAFEKIRKNVYQKIMEEVKTETRYKEEGLILARWQTVMSFWDYFSTISNVASAKLESVKSLEKFGKGK